jgi:hypothetical protein
VTLQGQAVSGARVLVTSAAGTVELREGDDEGTYRGTQVGYHRVYRLDVDAGSDYIEGAAVVGPDIHHFTGPEEGQTVFGGEDLLVEWAREEAAEVARLETRGLDERSVDDTGSFLVDRRDLDSGDERVRLRRSNQVGPQGAASGTFKVEVRNRMEFAVSNSG